jgi:hypothetical protein
MSKAHNKIIQKPKKKIAHKTHSEMFIINRKYLGEEPNFSKITEVSRINLIRAFSWYGYMCDVSESKEYAITYFNSIDRKDLSKIIQKISDDMMIRSIGWTARLISNGHILSQQDVDDIVVKTQSLSKYITVDQTNVIQFIRPKKTIDITILEEEIDKIIFSSNPDFNSFKFYEFALSNQLSKTTIQTMKTHIESMISYYKEVLNGKDDQLNEGYSTKSKIWKKNIVDFYTKMFNDCERLLDNVKKTRKPRVKKAVTTDKLLKNFRIQRVSNEYKLQSLPANKIIGANEVWLFNTKYKTLTVLRSNEGFSVDRMTITNVDETKSFQKNIGTRSEKILPNILSGTKAFVKKQFEEINRTQSNANPRSSEFMIILRVF